MYVLRLFKGALCGFGLEIQAQNFNIYNINEVITQTQKYLLFHDWINKQILSEGMLFKTRNVAGSAKYKQSKTVWNFVVI